MANLQITITDAGRAEIINATNTGTNPVLIAEVGMGSGKYAPDPAQLALVTETKRLATISGVAVSPDTIHVTIRDETADAYNVSEIGLYTAAGTLFAVYSDPLNDFLQKTAGSTLLLSVDIVLGTLDATAITFGDTSFANPPASETVPGVALIASQIETDTGTDDAKLITSKKLQQKITDNCIGINQTWVNLTPTRQLGVTYTNTTGKPIVVVVSAGDNNNGLVSYIHTNAAVDGIHVGSSGSANIGSSVGFSLSFIVPNNANYLVTADCNVVAGIRSWAELR